LPDPGKRNERYDWTRPIENNSIKPAFSFDQPNSKMIVNFNRPVLEQHAAPSNLRYLSEPLAVRQQAFFRLRQWLLPNGLFPTTSSQWLVPNGWFQMAAYASRLTNTIATYKQVIRARSASE
jgi:hypothetical protein